MRSLCYSELMIFVVPAIMNPKHGISINKANAIIMTSSTVGVVDSHA